MSEFRPGDVWRRKTKEDSELVILRQQRDDEVWEVVAVSIGRVSGYSRTIERTISEDELIEEWTPLVPDEGFQRWRFLRSRQRDVARFAEECDPWMTPRKDPNDLGGLVPEAGDDG